MIKSKLSRRTLLALAGLAAAGAAAEYKFGIFNSNNPKKGKYFFTFWSNVSGNYLMVVDFEKKSIQEFKMPQNAHFFEKFDVEKQIYLGTNRTGSYLTKLDLSKNSFEVFEPDTSYSLMGHVAYSKNKKYLCATARKEDKEAKVNSIVLLDQTTFKVIDAIELPGGYPPHHDCKFLPNTEILATTADQNISFVDMNSKTVRVQKVPFENPLQNVRHFSLSDKGDLAIQSNVMFGTEPTSLAYSDGAIVVHENSSNQTRVLNPVVNDMNIYNREMLDFEFSPNGDFFASLARDYNYVTFWDFKTGQHFKSVPMKAPIRIIKSNDRSHFIVLTGYGLRFINTKTLEVDTTMNMFDQEITNSLVNRVLAGEYIVVAHRQLV